MGRTGRILFITIRRKIKLISIGLPVIKTIFFEQALKSILGQTYKDFEIIVVNNNSPEDVESILSNYNDERIRYYKNSSTLPIIENWNKVLSYAQGEYFILFSDDDIAKPAFLEELFNLSQRYPAVNIFHTRVRIIDENNSTKYLAPSCPEFETDADFIWHRIKNYRFQYAPDFMVKTEALRSIGGFIDFPNAWGSDDATWFKIANNGGIAASPKILINWRESNINLSSQGNVEEKLFAVEKHFEWLKNFVKKDLNLNEDDLEIKNEIDKNIGFRYGVQQGYAIWLGISKNAAGIIDAIVIWLKFRKRFSLGIISLGWALGLLVRGMKRK